MADNKMIQKYLRKYFYQNLKFFIVTDLDKLFFSLKREVNILISVENLDINVTFKQIYLKFDQIIRNFVALW